MGWNHVSRSLGNKHTLVKDVLLQEDKNSELWWFMTGNTDCHDSVIEKKRKQELKERFTASVFTYQVNRVKHLNFSYRGTAGVRQITVVIADGQSAQSCRDTK